MSNNTKEEITNSNEKENTQVNSVFARKVKLINPVVYFFNVVLSAIWKAIYWLFDLVVSMFVSLGHFFKMVGLGVYHGVIGIKDFFKRKAHQFKYNDRSGRLSFIIFGFSSFSHKQYVNGVLFLLFEVVYIVLFSVFGVNALYMLTFGKLGLVAPGDDPFCEEDFCPWTKGDNSIMILIYGLLWIISIFFFIYIWNRSINSGYTNYRIQEYVRYGNIYKNNMDISHKFDEDAKEAFKNKVSLRAFITSKKGEIDEYVSNIEDKKEADYIRYLLINNCRNTYKYLNAVKKQEKVIQKLEAKKQNLQSSCDNSLKEYLTRVEEMRKEHQDDQEYLEKLDVSIEKRENKSMSKLSKMDNKIKKQEHVLYEIHKTYLVYFEVQETRNNDRYGKFNNYYKYVASLDDQILFYTHYQEFKDLYESKLDKFDDKNKENAQKIISLEEEMNQKIANTHKSFDVIREKKKALNDKLVSVKQAYKEEVKTIKASSEPNKNELLLEAKSKLVDDTTEIMRSLNDLPTDKNIKLLEKEEIKESKNAYNRDKKYLKTNFTSTEFALQEVIDMMIVKYKLNYKEAEGFAKKLLVKENKQERFLSEEEVNQTLLNLNNEKDSYISNHEDKYEGKPISFKETIRSLFNDKFHITILALPVFGILFMSIMPLLFSILVAFTNYSAGHVPPTQLFTWVGLENFFTLFNPPADSIYAVLPNALAKTVGWTMIWAIVATFSNYILGIVVALLINKEGIKFKKLWRTVFMMTVAIPQFISLLSIATLIKDTGAVGYLFNDLFGHRLGFGSDTSANGVLITKLIIILVNVWIGIPYTILSTTGILLNIPKDLYESAKVDGAGTVTQFTKITMPYILFVTGPYLITQFIGNINNFNVIFFLTGGGPALIGSGLLGLGQTDLLITFLYKIVTSTNNPQYGIASTIGIVIFIICSFISIVMYNKSNSIKEEDQFQ